MTMTTTTIATATKGTPGALDDDNLGIEDVFCGHCISVAPSFTTYQCSFLDIVCSMTQNLSTFCKRQEIINTRLTAVAVALCTLELDTRGLLEMVQIREE